MTKQSDFAGPRAAKAFEIKRVFHAGRILFLAVSRLGTAIASRKAKKNVRLFANGHTPARATSRQLRNRERLHSNVEVTGMARGDTGITEQINEIQRQMARARLEIHQDVGGAVDGVQLLTDWRTIVRSRPWLSLAVAAALGYAIVPRKSFQQPPAGLAQNAVGRCHGDMPSSQAPDGTTRRGGWQPLSSAFALIAPVAVQVAQTYALRVLENWLAASSDPPACSDADHQRTSGAGRAERTTTPTMAPREY